MNHNTDAKQIGKRLKAIREYSGLSRGEFGALFNSKERTVYEWEFGRCVPKLIKLVNISDYYGVSLDYIISGKESSKNAFEKMLSESDDLQVSEPANSYYAGKFIVQFNSLPPTHKERMIGYLDAIYSSM